MCDLFAQGSCIDAAPTFLPLSLEVFVQPKGIVPESAVLVRSFSLVFSYFSTYARNDAALFASAGSLFSVTRFPMRPGGVARMNFRYTNIKILHSQNHPNLLGLKD